VKLATLITMILVPAVVWGGFLVALTTAMKKEAQKFGERNPRERTE
jgi:hypothetical protein